MKNSLVAASLSLALVLSNPGASLALECRTDVPVTLDASGDIIRSGAITKLDLSWFGLEGSAAGPAFFSLRLSNASDTEQTVRVLVEMEARPTDPSIRDICAAPCWLQREMSVPIAIPAHGVVVKTSRDLYSTEFEAGGVEAASSPFKSLIGKLGFIPSTYLSLGFRLICENPGSSLRNLAHADESSLAPFTVNGQTAQIRSDDPLGPDGVNTPFYQTIKTPDLLSPGAPPSDGLVEIFSTSPTFVFQSELANPIIVYPAQEPKFTLELWKLADDETPGEAIERRALGTSTGNVGIVPFPASWATLEPGQKYVWRVSAHLRGPVQEPLYSELHTFEVSQKVSSGSAPSGFQRTHETGFETQDQIDRRINAILSNSASGRVLSPEERRLFRALFAILGDDPRLARLMASDIVDLDHLRLDGHPSSLETVEALAAQLADSRRKLTLVEFP